MYRPVTRALLTLVLLLAAVSAAERPLWSFGAGEQWQAGGRDGNGVQLQATGNGLRIELPASEQALEVTLSEPGWCEGSELEAVRSLAMDVSAEGDGHELGVNLLDASGEGLTLHPRAIAVPGRVAWQVPADVVWSWAHHGSQAERNRRIDGSARLLHLFIKRGPSATPSVVELGPASGDYRPAGDDPRYRAAAAVWTFGSDGDWALGGGKGAAAELIPAADGLLVRLPASDAPLEATIASQVLEREGYLPDLLGIELQLDCSAPAGAELGINLWDEDDEGFSLASRPLGVGDQVLRWSVPGSFVWSWARFGRSSAKNGVVDGSLRPLGIFIRRGPSAEPTEIVLRQAEGQYPVWNRVLQGVETGHRLRILRPGEEERLALLLANPLAVPLQLDFAGRIEDFDGATRDWSFAVELAPGSSMRQPIPRRILGERHGIKWLDYRLEIDGRSVPGRRQSFAYVEPAGPSPRPAALGDGFWFCLHQDFWRWRGTIDSLGIEVAALAGANAIRGSAEWDRVNTAPGVFDWTHFDAMVETAAAQQLELFASLWGTPRWAARVAEKPKEAKWWSRLAPKPEAMEAWARAVGERYRGRIRLWELSNEPDYGNLFYVGSHQDLVAAQQAAWRGLKAVDPQSVLMTSGFAKAKSAANKRSEEKGHIHERVVVDAQGSYDLHNVHLHGSFGEFVEAVDGELARIRSLVAKPAPLFFGETAQPARGGLRSSEREQAEILVKKLSFAWARGAVGYTWFHIWDGEDWDLADDWQDMAWGLYTANRQPKAVWCAHNQLARQLRGKRFVGELALGSGRWGFVFGDAQEQVLVAWIEDQALADELLVLQAGGASTAAQVDLMGNRSELAIAGDRVAFQLTAQPRYLVLSGAIAPRLLGRLLAVPQPPVASPGSVAAITLHALNPLEAALQLELGLDDRRHRLDLAPGTERTLTLQLAVPEDAVGGLHRAGLVYRLGGLEGELLLPIRLGTRLTDRAPDGREADWLLEDGAQLVNANTFMLGSDVEALKWGGPADLSARAWWWLDGERLRLQVDVRDDVHAPQAGVDLSGRGDGLRLILQDPAAAYRGWWELTLRAPLEAAADLRVLQHDFYASGDGLRAAAESSAEPIAGGYRYQLALPLAALRMDRDSLRRGLRANLQVVDRDAEVIDGWMQRAPGIAGEGPKDATGFPVLLLAEDAP